MGLEAASKKFLASKALLRTNSKREPWSWLVPDLVTALMTPPAERP